MGSAERARKNRVTKELALAITPIAAAYLFTLFYEAGYSGYFGIPVDLIQINFTDVFLTNRLTLIAAVIAFLWIGLYYNVLPSASSPIFKGIITVILILSLWLGFTFGRTDAKTKTEYLVTNSRPEHVVLTIYGDNLIMVPFNRLNHNFEKNFKIIKVGADPSLVYKLENVGPLESM